MNHNQKSASYSKKQGKLALAITLLSALLLGTVSAGVGTPQPVTAQGDNPNPPDQVVKLVFIHHSCGENWLADDHGGLGLALGSNNYFVSDSNYGWGPNSIGDRTDILDWPEWFNGPDSGMYLDALYSLSEQNSWYTRQLADPGGENQIILFKSCFPNSDLEGSPGDPPSDDDYLTVGSAKRVYTGLLSYFATRQDKLFVAITAPPLLDPAHSANARAFNNWLVHDWLRDYPHRNVAVFDFYNILTGPDNHHRFYNGTIEHVTMGGDTLYYPTNGDEHPNPTGNQKATSEFIPLLNIYYHRWQEEGPPSQPAPTQPPAVEAPATEAPATEEPAAEEPATEEPAQPALPPAEAGLVDDFEGTYGPYEGWEVWSDVQAGDSMAVTLDNEVTHSGNTSLRMEFDIGPGNWADFGRSFDSIQDWSDGMGLSMWLRFSGDAASSQEMQVFLFSGDPDEATAFETWFEILPGSLEEPVASEAEGWLLVELPWDRFSRAEWASGLSELDPSQMVGIGLSFGAPEDSRNKSTVWLDDMRLLEEAPQPAPTEAAPAAPATPTEVPVAAATATEAPTAAAPTPPPAPTTPPEEEGEGGGLCPISVGLALAGLVLTRRGTAKPK
jgi:hypothetical protein